MTGIRKLFGLVALAATMGVIGTGTGLTMRSAFAGDAIIAPGGGCEQDECEGGTTCKDNGGQNTSCSMSGGGCVTGGCSSSE